MYLSGASGENRSLAGCRLLPLLLTVTLIAGCAAAEAPQIDDVSPQRIPTGSAAQLLVSGSGFEKGDTIWIGTVALTGTVWVNSRLLSATVDMPLPAAPYNVTVRRPDGRRAERVAAVVVGGASPSRQTSTPTPAASRTPSSTAQPTRTPASTPTETPTASPTPARSLPSGPPAAFDITGHWSVVNTVQDDPTRPRGIFLGDVTLIQAGHQVTGSGERVRSLEGTISGRTLVADYIATDGTSGQFVWTFGADDKTFSGRFTIGSSSQGTSNGTLIRYGP